MPLNKVKKLIDKAFYSPAKVIAANPDIIVDSSTVVLPNTTFRINKGNKIVVGKDSMIACNFIFESSQGEITVGDRTFINSGTNLISRSKITIGNDVTISWGCTIYDHNSHSLKWQDRKNDLKQQLEDYRNGLDFIQNKNWDIVKTKPITIEDKVWLGFDCVILNGVTIGEGAIIGAKSVVRKDVPPFTIVAGNPAIVLRELRPEER